MILVLLGTQDKQFDRLLKEVSDLKEQGKIKEEVVAQIGCSKFRSKYIKAFDFVSKDEINDLIKDSDKRKELGSDGRRKIKNYSKDKVLEQWLKIINK